MKNIKNKNYMRGFSFIELLIAISIFIIVIGGIYAVNRSANRVHQVGMGTNLIGRVPTAIVDNISMNCMQGKVIFANASSLVIQLPVDLDNDGDVLDDAASIQWGVVDKSGVAQDGWSMRYIFVPDAAATTRSEATLNEDFNEDGDTTDTYQSGYLHKQLLNAAGAIAIDDRITDNYVLYSTNDPMFLRLDDSSVVNPAGKNVRFAFIVLYVDREGRAYSQTTEMTITPRNQY